MVAVASPTRLEWWLLQWPVVFFERPPSVLLVVSLLACSQGEAGLERPTELVVESPARGTILEGDSVVVRGRLAQPDRVADLRIADRQVSVADDGSFELSLRTGQGIELLHTIATLDDGSTLRDTRAVLSGRLVDPETLAPHGMRLELSPTTLDSMGRAAGRALAGTNLGALLEASGPVVQTGGNCFEATLGITGFDVEAIDVVTRPAAGGLDVEVTLADIAASLGGDYAAACLPGRVDVGFTADAYHVKARLDLSAAQGNVSSAVDIVDSNIDNFAITLTGVGFIDDAITNVDWLLGPALGWLMEDRLGPAFETALDEVAWRQFEVPIGDDTLHLDTRAELLELREDGGRLEIGTAAYLGGGQERGYLQTPVVTPIAAQPAPTAGFDLRVADEVFHQALAAIWGTGLLTQVIDSRVLGAGDFGGNLEEVAIDLRLPPAVDFGDRKNPPALVIGDLIVELRGKGRSHAKLAISARFDLTTSVRKDLEASGTVLQAQTEVGDYHVDVIGIHPDSRDLLDEELIEVIAGATLKRATRQLSELIAFIELPTFGETTVVEPVLFARPGYLQLEGELGVAK